MKPETTGYGMYRIYWPMPIKPKTIWNKPVIKNTVRIIGNAWAKSPSFTAIMLAINTILTAVMGAVGPEI